MSLNERIQSDYFVAYKAKDSLRLGVLRHLKTAATNLSVDLKRETNDDEMLEGEELEKAILEAIAKTGAGNLRDMGKVMASLTEDYRGRLDGKRTSALVREKLA